MPDPAQPAVSIIVPAYNQVDLLRRCLESLRRSDGVTYEAIVVDNASPESLESARAAAPDARWLTLSTNEGYAAACNAGMECAEGRYVALANSDIEVEPDTLAALSGFLDANPNVGAVTPSTISPDGSVSAECWLGHTYGMAWLQDSGLHVLLRNRYPFRHWTSPPGDWAKPRDVKHAQTTCLLVRREANDAIGGMDPRLFLFYNDVDYCLRLRRAGWRICYLPSCRVLHYGSKSVGAVPWRETQLWRDRYRYCAKWYGVTSRPALLFALYSRAAVLAMLHMRGRRFQEARACVRQARDIAQAMVDSRNAD